MITKFSLRQNKMLILLTAALVMSVGVGISQAGWTRGIELVALVSLGSIVIGLMISRSMLPGVIAHIFSLIIGIAWSFWLLSRRLPASFTWEERWLDLTSRMQRWVEMASNNATLYDNEMFIFQMSVITWIVGYVTIWFIFRAGRIWSAIVPGGVVLTINLFYAPTNITIWFLSYLLFALLLVIRYNLLQNELEWRAQDVYFRSDIGFDFMRDGLVFSVLLIALAWFTPVMSEAETIRVFGVFDYYWRDVQSEWNRLFAGLNYRPDTRSTDNFSQRLNLGGARVLSDDPIMYVDAPQGRYWRAATYDEYNGRTWLSNDTETLNLTAFQTGMSLPRFEGRAMITQTYTVLQNNRVVLNVMNNPVQISRDVRVKTTNITPQETQGSPYRYWSGMDTPWHYDITYVEADQRLTSGEAYRVVSLRSTATQADLRADDGPYPAWVEDRYLQLPDDVSPRVLDLAAEITADADTAFDKANAIEAYLREEIIYNEQIDAPPADRNAIEYILFDLQEAYCDYYATSMIVMLRSLGVPARMAAGYARGALEELENGEELYLVRSRDAHSWVEVFFPSYGWVEFEPTAAQPSIARARGGPDEASASPPSNLPEFYEDDEFLEEEEAFNRQNDEPANASAAPPPLFVFALPFFGTIEATTTTVGWFGGITALLVLMVGGWQVYRYRRQGDTAVLPDVSDVYSALLRLAAWVGVKKEAHQTPFEHAGLLGQTLPTADQEIGLITGQYVHQQFSRQAETTVSLKARVADAWDAAKPAFYRAVFERFNPLNRWRR